MKKVKILLTVLASFLVLSPTVMAADITSVACKTLNDQNQKTNAVCSASGQQTNPAIHVINVASDIFALLAGVAAVILIIVSGITLITSSGNAEAVGNAKKRITNAIIGLLIIAFAWTIITFATDKLIK